MRQLIISFFLLIALRHHAFSQDQQDNEAVPILGWDSLKKMVIYPEIARRAEFETHSNVEIQIDSAGNVGQIKITGGELFHQMIQDLVKTVKWYPAHIGGKARSTVIYFEIQFRLRQPEDNPKHRILVIERDGVRINKNQ